MTATGPDGTPYTQTPAWTIRSQQDYHYSQKTIDLLLAAGERHPSKKVDVGALLFALSVPESSGRCSCRTGCHYGLVQVSSEHRASMKHMGLAWDEAGRLDWAALTILSRLGDGQSLRTALGPWAETRVKAMKIYKRVTE